MEPKTGNLAWRMLEILGPPILVTALKVSMKPSVPKADSSPAPNSGCPSRPPLRDPLQAYEQSVHTISTRVVFYRILQSSPRRGCRTNPRLGQLSSLFQYPVRLLRWRQGISSRLRCKSFNSGQCFSRVL